MRRLNNNQLPAPETGDPSGLGPSVAMKICGRVSEIDRAEAGVAEARVVIEGWRLYDNKARPHWLLGYKPPAPSAKYGRQ